jgi:glycine dehydrogenase subunit 1
MAVTAAVQLGWLGTSGLAELATRCAAATRYARDAVLGIDGITPWADAPVLREFAVQLPLDADTVIERMADAGFLAGISLDGAVAGGAEGLLIAATERRTAAQIDAYAAALAKAVA